MIKVIVFDFFGVIYQPGGVIDWEVLDWALELKKNCKTALLSNVHGIGRYIDRGLLGQYFDLIAPSDEIGFMKPDKQAFQYVINHFGFEPEEAIVIDDLERHCAAAKEIGMGTVRFETLTEAKAALLRLL